ncbi:MAG: GntR family transcriptional regulator [Spirochaetales bacterium]|nr:GntR family transcriptional regulator [Spirochaetales bacterium]
MAAERQTGGVRFILDPTSGVPFYRQVIMHMEMAIADGRLCTGNQLPTVRALAVDLQINPNTVARAYNELEIRGIVNTQQGTGTFVSEKKMELTDREREETLAGLVRSFLATVSSYGFSIEEAVGYLSILREGAAT